jgi:hypothetical protein
MDVKSEKVKRGTWDQLRILPGRLTQMVIRGEAKIVGKDRFGRRIYELKK